MKKFFSIVAALIFASAMVSAQTVEGSRTFENIYVGVEGGALAPLTNVRFNTVRPTLGIELGKDFTPVVGASLEFLGNINTTGAHTWFDQSNLVLNGKVNLSNWFGGYKGYPRRVEFLLVPGIGWGHFYGFDGYTPEQLNAVLPYGKDTFRNYLTYNAYGQINFNLGKARAWQINVKPGVTWATGAPNIGAYKQNADLNVRVGVTYKFGSRSKKSHNFVLGYTSAQYSAMVAERDAARAAYDSLKAVGPVKEVIKETVIKEKETIVEKAVVKPASTIITFDMGSATLKAVEYAKVKAFASQVAEGDTVVVVGSADLGTGSKARNDALANARAKVVASALNSLGLKTEVTTKFDTNDNAEASRAAVVYVR